MTPEEEIRAIITNVLTGIGDYDAMRKKYEDDAAFHAVVIFAAKTDYARRKAQDEVERLKKARSAFGDLFGGRSK